MNLSPVQVDSCTVDITSVLRGDDSDVVINQPVHAAEGELVFCICFIFIFEEKLTILSDHHLLDYPYEICTIGRNTAVDQRSEVCFSIPRGTLPWQPIFGLSPGPVHRIGFACDALEATYDKKCKCCARRRRTS